MRVNSIEATKIRLALVVIANSGVWGSSVTMVQDPKLLRSSPTSNKQLVVVLSKLASLSLPMTAIFCRCDFNLAALKTFYDGKIMLPVILGNSEGWYSPTIIRPAVNEFLWKFNSGPYPQTL